MQSIFVIIPLYIKFFHEICPLGAQKKLVESLLAAATEKKEGGGAGGKKMISANLATPAEKTVSVLISALVEKFGVSRMRDFFFTITIHSN